jgi:hypothetical protein
VKRVAPAPRSTYLGSTYLGTYLGR